MTKDYTDAEKFLAKNDKLLDEYLLRSDEICGMFEATHRIMQLYADQQTAEKDKRIRELEEKVKKLEFMIDKGLGWDDMKNDITMPHEI